MTTKISKFEKSEDTASSPGQRVAEDIHSLAIHLLRKLRREDTHSGLSAPRLSALSVIVFAGPITLKDLAAAEQVRSPTMTRVVQALEELGLVDRTANTSDARSSMLSATAAGKTLLLEGRERRVRALSTQIIALDPTDRDTLREATEILKRVVQAI
jgi:DNA-binding MarR family transcriptional regulator